MRWSADIHRPPRVKLAPRVKLGGATNPLWAAVDDYWTGKLHVPDTTLDAALADSAAAGLPPIAVTPALGKMLQLLARVR